MSEKGAEATQSVFKQYIGAVLPFMSKQQADQDSKMKEVMERETKKGVIVFNAPEINPIVSRAKEMRLPDDFREKLAQRSQRVVEV